MVQNYSSEPFAGNLYDFWNGSPFSLSFTGSTMVLAELLIERGELTFKTVRRFGLFHNCEHKKFELVFKLRLLKNSTTGLQISL